MNTSTSLSQDLLTQLQGAPLQQLARQLGTDTAQTSQAVSAALPLLLGALGTNAARPQGAASLLGALQRDHTGDGSDLGGLLASLLNRDNGASGAAGILGHIFGGRQRQVETGLGEATGMSENHIARLLSLLAPIVMSFLAQRVQAGHMDAGTLGQTLERERAAAQREGGPEGGLLGSLLDQDGDGQVGLNDLLKIGGSLLGGRR